MAKAGLIGVAVVAVAAAAAGSAAVWWWVSRKRGPISGSPAPKPDNSASQITQLDNADNSPITEVENDENAPAQISQADNVRVEDVPLEGTKVIGSSGNGDDLTFPVSIQLLKEERRCFNCFRTGHPSALCAKKQVSRCMHCGKFGHKAYRCYSKLRA